MRSRVAVCSLPDAGRRPLQRQPGQRNRTRDKLSNAVTDIVGVHRRSTLASGAAHRRLCRPEVDGRREKPRDSSERQSEWRLACRLQRCQD